MRFGELNKYTTHGIFGISVGTAVGLAASAGSLAAGLAGGGGGGGGGGASAAQIEQAVAEAKKNQELWNNVDIPSLKSLQVKLKKLVLVGQLSPIEAATFMQEQTKLAGIDPLGQSEFAGITTDPELTLKQFTTIQAFQEIADNGGLNDEDRAHLHEIALSEGIQAKGLQDSIVRKAAERGIAGSGIEMAAQMQNQQSAVTRQSQRDMDVAAMGQQRRREALGEVGDRATQMRAQEFGEKATIAENVDRRNEYNKDMEREEAIAQDDINRFNTMNRQAVELYNTEDRRHTRDQNLAEQQRIRDANVGITNTQRLYNKQQRKDRFNMGLQKTQGQSNANTGVANAYLGQAAHTQQGERDDANRWGGYASTLASLAGAFASDERAKDVDRPMTDEEAQEFLRDIHGQHYSYKGEDNKNVGVMAQDVEQNPVGDAVVVDTPKGKAMDSKKLLETLTAIMGSINSRLERVEGTA